jgi:hypothetical protein
MASNTNDLFNSHEMEEGKGQYVDSIVGVRDVLGNDVNHTSTIIQDFDKLYIGRNLTSWLLDWSLPLKPMLDP